MSSWAQRARVHFSQERQDSAIKTIETTLSMVSEVASGRFCEKNDAQIHADLTPANDPQINTTVSEVVDIGTIRPVGLSPVLLAASLDLDRQIDLNGVFDSDRWCWTNSEAMTGHEIDSFITRIARFTCIGVNQASAEALAVKLLQRDRSSDDRRVCLECKHLVAWRAAWGCGAMKVAGVAIHSRNARLPADFVIKLQRCEGFISCPAPV